MFVCAERNLCKADTNQFWRPEHEGIDVGNYGIGIAAFRADDHFYEGFSAGIWDIFWLIIVKLLIQSIKSGC